MNVETYNKFPCGFEESTKFKTTMFDFAHFESKSTTQCPLHGKNCKKSK